MIDLLYLLPILFSILIAITSAKIIKTSWHIYNFFKLFYNFLNKWDDVKMKKKTFTLETLNGKRSTGRIRNNKFGQNNHSISIRKNEHRSDNYELIFVCIRKGKDCLTENDSIQYAKKNKIDTDFCEHCGDFFPDAFLEKFNNHNYCLNCLDFIKSNENEQNTEISNKEGFNYNMVKQELCSTVDSI